MQKGTRCTSGERGTCVVFGYWSLWSINTQRQGIDLYSRERSQRARSYPSIFIIELRQQQTILDFFFLFRFMHRSVFGWQNIINERSTRWFMSSVADSLCLSSSTHTMSCAPTDFHRMREYNKICYMWSSLHSVVSVYPQGRKVIKYIYLSGT